MTKRFLTSIFALVASFFSNSAVNSEESKLAGSEFTDNPAAVTFPGFERYTDLHGFYSVLLRNGPYKKRQIDQGSVKLSEILEEDKDGIWSVGWADLRVEVPGAAASPKDALNPQSGKSGIK